MSKVIGIDLGTAKCVAAVIKDGKPVIIPSSEGERATPSVVGFTKGGSRLVGLAAKRQSGVNCDNTIYSIKRFMGRRFNEVSDEIEQVSYKVVRASNGDTRVAMGGREYSPPEISAMILQKIKQAAEAFLGEEVTQAVIAVPAYFNDSQRKATRDAGRIAGLDVLRIINGPAAVGLAYARDRVKDETIAVFDFGGGMFDISIIEVGKGLVEVKSVNGDTRLGGDNLDERLIRWIVDEFQKEHRIDLSQNRWAWHRLKDAAEIAKIQLSVLADTKIDLAFITADQTGPKHLTMKVTRSKFEELVDDILNRLLVHCRQAIKDAGLAVGEIDNVILVGSSTRIPKVSNLVKDFFGKEPLKNINPEEVVAAGAALQAGALSGDIEDLLLLDVMPLSLGIETSGGAFTKLIERNSQIYQAEKIVADDRQAPPVPDVSSVQAAGGGVGGQNIYDESGAHPSQRASGRQLLPTIFISYAHMDGTDLARRLEADLRANGFNTWWDDGIAPGEEWMDAIQEAIDQSSAMVVVFTEAAVNSLYVKNEWRYAREGRKITIIPVLAPSFDERKRPMALYGVQWVDARSDYADALARLIKALRKATG